MAILILVLTAIPVITFAQIAKQPARYVEVGHATIHPSEFAQTLKLSFQSISENGDFNRIYFRSAMNIFVLRSAYDLRRLNLPGDPEARTPDFDITSLALHPSRYFRTGTYKDESGMHTLIFFIGEASASNPCSVLIVGFDSTGKPYKVLEKKTLEVTAFLQPIGDQPARIVGKPTLSQVVSKNLDNPMSGPYATTYDPSAVYTLSASAKAATYSLAESRLYNQRHYFWAGPRSSEKLFVYYNVPGRHRPFLAAANDSDKILK